MAVSAGTGNSTNSVTVGSGGLADAVQQATHLRTKGLIQEFHLSATDSTLKVIVHPADALVVTQLGVANYNAIVTAHFSSRGHTIV